MNYQFSAGTVSSKIDVAIESSEAEIVKDVWEYSFLLSWDINKAKAENDTLVFEIVKPIVGCRNRWNPGNGASRKLDAVWRNSIGESKLSSGAPVTCIFNTDDKNTYTFAVSEILKCVTVNAGPSGSDNTLMCMISLPMAQYNEADHYSFKILVDERKIPYYETLDFVRKWWEDTCHIDPMKVSPDARLPMYSSWYSYQRNITDKSLEAECKLAKALGLDTIIVDDGWQMENDNRRVGYGCCGDWEVVPSKIADMKSHVARVHELGMKYMLWFSVPYMGLFAKNYQRFEGKYIGGIRKNVRVLDPRYPEVREYLVGTFERFVRDYELDGLKLDFIDRISAPADDCAKEGMDFTCVQEATSALMTEVRDRLLAINPDFMIEFRQSYIGPGMRRFGNMFRVGDCHNDGFTNHLAICDIRLLAGNSAVHSDMVTWHHSEPVEDCALQVLDCLFGVMQYSLKIAELDDDKVKMSRFWIDFMKKNQKLLQESEFIPYEPQNLYPVITVRNGSEELTGVYARDRILTISDGAKHFYFANATRNGEVWVKSNTPINARVVVRNCMGDIISKEKAFFGPAVISIKVPTAGLIECFAE